MAVLAGIVATPAQAQTTARVTVSMDYLAWWVKGAPLAAPLISTGPSANEEGFLVNPDTTILYGAPFAPAVGGRDHQDLGLFSGGQLTLAYALDPARGIGLEASGFGLASRSAGYQASGALPTVGDGNGIRIPVYNSIPYDIGVPRDNVAAENGLPVSIPGVIGGQAQVSNRLSLWGLDVSGTDDLLRGGPYTVTGLAGLRYLSLAEDFDLSDAFYGLSGPFLGQSGTVRDHFGTSNRFIGAGFGLRGTASWGPISLVGTFRVAFGDMNQELNVAGSYDAVNFTPSAGPEGIFAQPANSGRRTKDAFAVVPELSVKLGYDITPNLRVTVGYDALYMNDVVRPGDQISHSVPKGQIFQQGGLAISTTSPARLFRTTDFYAQGLSAGLSVRF